MFRWKRDCPHPLLFIGGSMNQIGFEVALWVISGWHYKDHHTWLEG